MARLAVNYNYTCSIFNGAIILCSTHSAHVACMQHNVQEHVYFLHAHLVHVSNFWHACYANYTSHVISTLPVPSSWHAQTCTNAQFID